MSYATENLCRYKDLIYTTSIMCICSAGTDFYNQVIVSELEHQLKMMIGIIYDCETKSCIHNEAIKQCLKKLLKASDAFINKEIELIL